MSLERLAAASGCISSLLHNLNQHYNKRYTQVVKRIKSWISKYTVFYIFCRRRVLWCYHIQNGLHNYVDCCQLCPCLNIFVQVHIKGIIITKGPFKCYVTLFSGKLDPHPPPRNANNVEYYTFVTLFFGKLDTPPPPTALRNTWMAPKTWLAIQYS